MSQVHHLLELDNISKYYGNIIALRDVSTYVNAGEVTCVLGDNGAGKSTLHQDSRRACTSQTEGTIRMNGEEVSFDSPATRSPTASPPCTKTWRWCR